MKIIIVGFRVSEENSVYYKKLEADSPSDPKIAKAMALAIDKSDFISVRMKG